MCKTRAKRIKIKPWLQRNHGFLYGAKGRSAQRANLGDLEEQRALAAGGVERLGERSVLERLEADARAGDGVGLGALLAGRGRGVNGKAFAVGGEVGLGLILGQAELEVILVLVLDHGEDEVGGVRGAVRVGRAHQVEAGEGVDGVHQVVAGQRGIAIEVGDGSGSNGVGFLSRGGRHRKHEQHGEDKKHLEELVHGNHPFQSKWVHLVSIAYRNLKE